MRDLFLGPQRYTDLLAGLPGIATDMLTARLRTLEAEGLVRRRELPPPAPATVYELTEVGRGLRPLIRALGEVGLTLLDAPGPGEPINAGPVVMSLNLTFRPDAAPDLAETYGLEIDGRAFTVDVDRGTVHTERGAPARPTATPQRWPGSRPRSAGPVRDLVRAGRRVARHNPRMASGSRRVALVTGSSRGLGAAIARRLGDDGLGG